MEENLKRLQSEKDTNVIVSVAVFAVVLLALYFSFAGLGIESGKAGIEALVIASAIITPVVLYLFGRTWKKEIN